MTGKTRRDRIASRWATAEDLRAFYGGDVPRAVRARVLERDGRIVGVAGWYVDEGRTVMFSDVKGSIPKMTIWREAKAMMARMDRPAVCAAEGDGALLRRLGWTPAGEGVYEWHS